MKVVKWAEQVQDCFNGRILSRRPRLYQSCSAIEEDYSKCEEKWLCKHNCIRQFPVLMQGQRKATFFYR